MMYGIYGYGWPMVGGMIFWGLLCITLMALVTWLLVRWVNRSNGKSPRPTMSEPSAQETLRQRYARGEIDATTYDGLDQGQTLSIEVGPGCSPTTRNILGAIRSSLWETEGHLFDLLVSKHAQPVEKLN